MLQMSINESNCVALAKTGDRQAMHELYELNRSRIFNLAYRYVKNVPDAEDILQDTFVKAFKSLHKCQLNENSYFSTWLYRIAVNCAMDHFRSRRRRDEQATRQRDFSSANDGISAVTPESEFQRQQIKEQVERGLNVLSPRKRMIVVLRHYQQMKITEIAAYLGCSQGSVKKQLFRALAQLRSELQPLTGG
jgi:RNA polymerase sigma-70 factor (ECF subfamily)